MSEIPPVSADDFCECFGEELRVALDLRTWRDGDDLAGDLRRIDAQVREAIDAETALHRQVRDRVFSLLPDNPFAPPGAGRFTVTTHELERVTRELLFNGETEAADGHCEVADFLGVTAYDLRVALMSYEGHREWRRQRVYRRDFRQEHRGVVEDAIAILQRRRSPAARIRGSVSQLARRALLAFAERAVLTREATANWRMGHGSPAPYELLNGAGSPDLMIESVRVIRQLVQEHRRFVFVADPPDDGFWPTVGQALRPLEYVIATDLNYFAEAYADEITFATGVTVDDAWDGRTLTPAGWVRRFCEEVAPNVVVGVYRATLFGPPRLFFAHAELASVAVRLAMADSILREDTGSPMLLDLAGTVSRDAPGSRAALDAVGPIARFAALDDFTAPPDTAR